MVDNNASQNGTVQEETGDLLDQQRQPLAVLIIQAITMVAIIVIGTLANGVICHCILKHRSLRTVTNIFIMNLATTDFLLSILCMPFCVDIVYCGRLDIWLYYVQHLRIHPINAVYRVDSYPGFSGHRPLHGHQASTEILYIPYS